MTLKRASKSEESGNQLQDADNSPDENKIEFYIPKVIYIYIYHII